MGRKVFVECKKVCIFFLTSYALLYLGLIFQKLSIQLTVNVQFKFCQRLDSNRGLLSWKRPLYQLSDNHCPIYDLILGSLFFSLSWLIQWLTCCLEVSGYNSSKFLLTWYDN